LHAKATEYKLKEDWT